VNCYYKYGPATKNKTRVLLASKSDSGNGGSNDELYNYSSRFYIDGNYVTAASPKANYDWKGVTYDSGTPSFNGKRYSLDEKNMYVADEADVYTSGGKRYVCMQLSEPIDAGVVTTHSAENAYSKILDYCGASLKRDGHDTRYMEEARTGTTTYKGSLNGWKGIIDKCVDVIPGYTGTPYPWSTPEATTRPAGFDTDGDGIPDEWEKANGLNPNNKADGITYTLDPRKWYTNFEVYANSLVEHIVKAQNEDAIDAVDEYYPAFKTSGIAETYAPAREVIEIQYYNLSGMRIAEPSEGISIRRIIYSDGSVETDKVKKN
ncbi:MAG: thrombospondin type 3 repeat-containing protein, partial [Duncaniella sp.]|nr:thrombospondin type 3 repeat-containing protein [Duncaniella sp.]